MTKYLKKIIFFFTMIFILSPNNVYGASCGSAADLLGGGGDGSDGSGSGNDTIPYQSWTGYQGSGSDSKKRYQYRYKKSISTNNVISANAYDLSGTSAIPVSVTDFKTTFKAGTWIGINVQETQSASWRIWDFQFEEIKKKYTCQAKGNTQTKYCHVSTTRKRCMIDYGGSYSGKNRMCTYACGTYTTPGATRDVTVDYYETNPCKSFEVIAAEGTATTVSSDGGSLANQKKNEARTKAYNEAKSLVGAPLGEIEYITNNRFPDSHNKLNWKKIKGTAINWKDTGINGDSGSISVEYEYKPQKICMNLKTAKVTYQDECVENKKNGTVIISDGTVYDKYLGKTVSYWHYFIPLNLKSNEKFTLKVSGNEDRNLRAGECEYIMKNYGTQDNNYTSYIVPLNEKSTFSGDYTKLVRNSSDWKLVQRNNGCLFTTVVNFPIEQKFYNEEQEKDNLIFKGFNFYYRPIDIHNPFPNGIANDSYWKIWKAGNKTNPNLEDSFKNITYYATNISGSSIRQYNKDNAYTSWDKMNLNGTSSYITSNNIITRRVGTDSFYNLGCGPANKDWGECKK